MDAAENSEAEVEVEVELPSYFQCPISMQLMRDPVTICTGVTYERESIEKWIYTCGKNTCPATMQILQSRELTPNHTLLRLIQDWSHANSSRGVQRIPTPRAPLDFNQLSNLLQKIESPFQVKALKMLRSVAVESETNRRSIASSGAPAVLISLIESHDSAETDQTGCYDVGVACEEALGVLYVLPLPDETVDSMATAKFLNSVASILKRGTSSARFHAVMLMQSISGKVLERFLKNTNDDLIEGLLELLSEEVSQQATMAALEVLTAITSNSRRSRMKAIEAGAVSVLIESLPDQSEKRRSCEKMVLLMDVLCGCAEGRAAMIDHAMGIPAISKKIMRVSAFATEKAVRILWSLCKYSPSQCVLYEMAQIGAVTKLCMLLQVECTAKTKNKVKEMLKEQGKHWRSSSCVPSIMYPSIVSVTI